MGAPLISESSCYLACSHCGITTSRVTSVDHLGTPHIGCVGKWKQVSGPLSPNHYKAEGSTLEAIDVIESFKLGFNLGNVVKYIIRANKKGDRSENLKKARQYLNREIDGKWYE